MNKDTLVNEYLLKEIELLAETQLGYLEYYSDRLLCASAAVTTDSIVPTVSTMKPLPWNREDLEVFSSGNGALLLGADYSYLEDLEFSCRPPLPPFLFCDRVVHLSTKSDVYEGSKIVWEYEIKPGEWYLMNNVVPDFVLMESGHTVTLLLLCLGLDRVLAGNGRFRVLNLSSCYYRTPACAGDLFRGDMVINKVIRMGDRFLFEMESNGYINNELYCSVKHNSGFFHKKYLSTNSAKLPPFNAGIGTKKEFMFPPVIAQRTFTESQVYDIQNENLSRVLGGHIADLQGPLLGPNQLLMLDRVTHISTFSEERIELTTEKDLEPTMWFFEKHFKGDSVFPGVLGAEGCIASIRFFAYYLGWAQRYDVRAAKPEFGNPCEALFLEQILPEKGTLNYNLVFNQISEYEDHAILDADASVRFKGREVSRFRGIRTVFSLFES